MWCPDSRCPRHHCPCLCRSCHGWSLLLMSASASDVLSRLIVVWDLYRCCHSHVALPVVPIPVVGVRVAFLPCCPPLWAVPSQVDCCFWCRQIYILATPLPFSYVVVLVVAVDCGPSFPSFLLLCSTFIANCCFVGQWMHWW